MHSIYYICQQYLAAGIKAPKYNRELRGWKRAAYKSFNIILILTILYALWRISM